jgi:hypothetical protein
MRNELVDAFESPEVTLEGRLNVLAVVTGVGCCEEEEVMSADWEPE